MLSMAVSYTHLWGTSRLAFDGSGEILRGRVNLTNDELAALIAMETKDRKKAKGRPETCLLYTSRCV